MKNKKETEKILENYPITPKGKEWLKLQEIKKPHKHLLIDDNDNDIIDIWKRFDDDYEKNQ